MLEVRAATVDDADTISSLNDEVQNVHADALPHLFKPASKETGETLCKTGAKKALRPHFNKSRTKKSSQNINDVIRIQCQIIPISIFVQPLLTH